MSENQGKGRSMADTARGVRACTIPHMDLERAVERIARLSSFVA
jgi:hypothetical protein